MNANLSEPTPQPESYSGMHYLGAGAGFSEEICTILGGTPLFRQLSPAELRLLCRFFHCYAAEREATLFDGGDRTSQLVVTLTGKIAVCQPNGGGNFLMVDMLSPGDLTGEMSLIAGAPRSARYVAAEPCDIAVLTRFEFDRLVFSHPQLGCKLFAGLLDGAIQYMQNLNAGSERVLPDCFSRPKSWEAVVGQLSRTEWSRTETRH